MTKSPSETRTRPLAEPLGNGTGVARRLAVFTGALAVALIAGGAAVIAVGWSRNPEPPAVEVALAPVLDTETLASARTTEDVAEMETASGQPETDAESLSEKIADEEGNDAVWRDVVAALQSLTSVADDLPPERLDDAVAPAAGGTEPVAEPQGDGAETLGEAEAEAPIAEEELARVAERDPADRTAPLPEAESDAAMGDDRPAVAPAEGVPDAAEPIPEAVTVDLPADMAVADEEAAMTDDGALTPAAAPVTRGTSVTVIKRSNLRVDPDPDAPVIAKLEPGSQVVRLDDRPVMGYYNVAQDTTVGWIWWLNVDEPPDPDVARKLSDAERQRLADREDTAKTQ